MVVGLRAFARNRVRVYNCVAGGFSSPAPSNGAPQLIPRVHAIQEALVKRTLEHVVA